MEKLDLHGVKHEKVQNMVEDFVLLNDPPFEIVTGNSDKMRELVNAVLDEHEMVGHHMGNYGSMTVTEKF